MSELQLTQRLISPSHSLIGTNTTVLRIQHKHAHNKTDAMNVQIFYYFLPFLTVQHQWTQIVVKDHPSPEPKLSRRQFMEKKVGN